MSEHGAVVPLLMLPRQYGSRKGLQRGFLDTGRATLMKAEASHLTAGKGPTM